MGDAPRCCIGTACHTNNGPILIFTWRNFGTSILQLVFGENPSGAENDQTLLFARCGQRFVDIYTAGGVRNFERTISKYLPFRVKRFLLSSLPNCMPAGCGCVSYRRWRREPRTRNGELPLPAAVVCRGIGRGACRRRSSAREFRSLKRGSCREGVLSCLPRGDRASCDLVDCSQPHAGAGGPGICHAALYAGRRLVVRNCYCSAGSRPISPSCRGYCGSRSQIGCGKEISRW